MTLYKVGKPATRGEKEGKKRYWWMAGSVLQFSVPERELQFSKGSKLWDYDERGCAAALLPGLGLVIFCDICVVVWREEEPSAVSFHKIMFRTTTTF